MADDLLQMFQSITTHDHDELVEQFAYLLAVDAPTASFFLESSNWNVETAVNNYLATMEPALYHDSHSHHRQRAHQHGEDLAMEDGEGTGDEGDGDQEAMGLDYPSSGVYDAQFVTDLTVAQSTVIPPSTAVDMQWSFVNSGSVPWPNDTHLVFAQGDRFDGPVQIPVASISPGARIDLAIRLCMPPQMGTFSGSWRLVSPQGPIGEPMWLVLNVGASKQDTFEPTVSTDGFTAATAAAGAGGTGGLNVGASGGGFSNNDDDMMDL